MEKEEEMMKKLEKPHMLVRVGPILGLMGTLIPLGPRIVGTERRKDRTTGK